MDARDALRQMIHDYPGGIGTISIRIGKSASTLEKELANAHGYKLGVSTACQITQLCHEARVASAAAFATSVAAFCGGVVMLEAAHHAPGDVDLVKDLGRVLGEASEVVTAVTSAREDNRISANECRAIDKQVREAIASLQRLQADVDAALQRSQPVLKGA
jgi:hypothetical protein